jgi:WD40 repeat protein
VHTLQHEGSVLCLSYSDGGNLLASGSTVIKTLRVWQPVSEPASPVAGVGDGETTSTPDRSALCKLCMERGLEMMLMPCRHVALCTQCAVDQRMTRCLICRDILIECVVRVYVP